MKLTTFLLKLKNKWVRTCRIWDAKTSQDFPSLQSIETKQSGNWNELRETISHWEPTEPGSSHYEGSEAAVSNCPNFKIRWGAHISSCITRMSLIASLKDNSRKQKAVVFFHLPYQMNQNMHIVSYQGLLITSLDAWCSFQEILCVLLLFRFVQHIKTNQSYINLEIKQYKKICVPFGLCWVYNLSTMQ